MKYLFPLLFLALILPVSSFAASAYVQSIHADVFSLPSISSPKVMRLIKGDKVTVILEKGFFYQIKSNGKTGYVYKFLVNKNPVSDSEKLYSRLQSFFSKIETITEKSRRRPSSYTATAAARGLREKREHFAELYKSDYTSLEKFESIHISDDEALEFLRKGVSDETAH